MKYLIYIILFTSSLSIQAQTISGHVMYNDDQMKMQPLPGANIVWANTVIGVTSDETGAFKITRTDPSQQLLVISYVGYITDTVDVSKVNTVHVMLDPIQDLQAVVVQGEGSATAINTVDPVNMETLNKKELLKAACCNLSESFETNNSVDAEFSDAITGAKTIKMLGLDGVYSQIMTENMPNVRGLSSSYGLTFIPGPWIESIQVTKGPGSVVNGYESLTGSINTELKKPFDVDEEKFLFNVFGATSGRYEMNLNYKHLFNEKWSTALYTNTSQLHNKMDENNDGFLDAPLNSTFIVMNKWNYFSEKSHEAQFGIKYIQSNLTGGQTSFDENAPHTVDNGYGVGVDIARWEVFMKNGFVFKRPNTSIGTIVSYANHDQQSFYGLNNYAGKENYLKGDFIFQTYIFNTDHLLKTGASFVYDDFNETYDSVPYLRTEKVPGVFVEYYYKSGTKWSVLAGARADEHNLYGLFFTPRIHLKYSVTEKTTLRASAGKGYRVADIFAENTNILTSSRELVVADDLQPEEGWNYGVSLIQNFSTNGHDGVITLDAYRTDFINQVVVDVDSDPAKIYVGNLHGASYSNVLQAEISYEPVKDLNIRLAAKYVDAKETYHDMLMEVPLTNRYRGLFNVAYDLKKWGITADFTTQYIGISRLPDLTGNPEAVNVGTYSPDYFLLLGQITKHFKWMDLYIGSENLTNYTQQDPIIDPAHPFGENFDASVVYAPVMQRKFYGGLRIVL